MSDGPRVSRVARRVPPGRAAYLDAQRVRIRSAILDGGRTVFARTPYLRVSVDDILAVASVSRATFYQHFESKTDLAFAIYEEMRPEVAALFDEIMAIDPRCEASVRQWVERYIALYDKHRYVAPFLAQLQLFEPSFRDRLRKDRDHFIDRLDNAGSGGFAGASADPDRRTRARLMLARLTLVASEVSQVMSMPQVEAQSFVRVAIEDFATFLRGGRDSR